MSKYLLTGLMPGNGTKVVSRKIVMGFPGGWDPPINFNMHGNGSFCTVSLNTAIFVIICIIISNIDADFQ